MNFKKINVVLFSVLLSAGLYAQKKDCAKTCMHINKSTKVTFKSNKVYEFAYATVNPEKAEILGEYIQKVIPIAAKYGGKPFVSFLVVKSESEKFQVNTVAIFEWDSPQSRLNLLADKDYQKITHLRDAAIQDEMQFGWFNVSQDSPIEFKSDKIYEIGTANLVKDGGEILQEYNQIAEPIKRSYGGDYPEFKIVFESLKDSRGQATFSPQMQFIVEWRSLEDKDKLFANQDFKTKAVPILMKAIDTFDPVFTKINIQ
nr:DUF1330 domain-containing protein [uncultured Allomuricauda sp.]